jgi:hypothetical protein
MGILVKIIIIWALVGLELFQVLHDPFQTILVSPANANRFDHLDSSVELIVVGIISQSILLEIVKILVLLVGHSK